MNGEDEMFNRLRRMRNNIQHKEEKSENAYVIINTALIAIVIFIICLIYIFYYTSGRQYF